MCGIIAYKGPKDAIEIVLKGLQQLEYRGYDSWGIGVKTQAGLDVFKKTGQIGKVNRSDIHLPESTIAIGHTRWATHGGVTETNAHPHQSPNKDIVVVHNGIVENFEELALHLSTPRVSETDTEIIAHLISQNMQQGFAHAVRETAKKLQGKSGFVAINKDTDEIAAVRSGSPLIVGIGENEYFIASDVTAFLQHTKKVMYLDNNEMVVINDAPHFYDADGKEVQKRIVDIDWEAGTSEKGDHAHYLIKEIMDQKHTIMAATNQDEEKLKRVADEIRNAYGTFLVGCGTAGKVCQTSEYFFSSIAHKHINAVVGSEFSNYHHYLTDKTLMIPVSQSGETMDVLDAMEIAKKKGVKIISLINVVGSTMMRESDDYFNVNAGVEKAVVSTKATTAQLSVLYLLAHAVAGTLQEGKSQLMNTASAVTDMLNPRYDARIRDLAQLLKGREDVIIIGRGANYPIALEAAIKLMEASYVHAQGFAGGELKHGPIALIEPGTPVIVLVNNDENKEATISNAKEVQSRGGVIIGVAPENNPAFSHWIKVPDVGDAAPIVNIIPMQMLAYHLAVLRGIDPDKPRNLAKSVTVK